MGFWICFNCEGHNVYEKMYIRLNRQACIINNVDHLMEKRQEYSKWNDRNDMWMTRK